MRIDLKKFLKKSNKFIFFILLIVPLTLLSDFSLFPLKIWHLSYRRVRDNSEYLENQLESFLEGPAADFIIDKLKELDNWNKEAVLSAIIEGIRRLKDKKIEPVVGIILPTFESLILFAKNDQEFVQFFDDSIAKISYYVDGKTGENWWNEQPQYIFSVFSRIVNYSLGKEDPYLAQFTELLKKIPVLKNKTLNSLYDYLTFTPKERLKEKFPELTDADLKMPFPHAYIFLKITKSLPKNYFQWADRMKFGANTPWEWIPPDMHREIFAHGAESIFMQPKYSYYDLKNFLPLYRIEVDELEKINIPFIGSTFGVLYQFYGSDIVKFRTEIGAYPFGYKYLWLDLIRGNERVHWQEKELPLEVIEHLLIKIVQELNIEESEIKLPKQIEYGHFDRQWEFLSGPTNDYKGKFLTRLPQIYEGMEKLRQELCQPLSDRLLEEKETIIKKFQKGEELNWSDFNPWAWRLAWEEIDSGKQLVKLSSRDSGFLARMLELFPFIKDEALLKATLLYDIDLPERINHPITTEDWLLLMFFSFENVNWNRIPALEKEHFQRMGISLPIVSYKELIKYAGKFLFDPLEIFTSRFEKIVVLKL